MWSFPKDELKIIKGFKDSISIDIVEPEDTKIFFKFEKDQCEDKCALTEKWIGSHYCQMCKHFKDKGYTSDPDTFTPENSWIQCAKKKEALGL